MCRLNKTTIESNQISQLTHENDTLTREIEELKQYKSDTDLSLNDLHTKLQTCNRVANEQASMNNTLADKVTELQTDIEDKHDLVEQLTTKFTECASINQTLIDELKNETAQLIHKNTILNNNIIHLKTLLPSNVILYYFVGSQYTPRKNSLLLDLKKHFKNTFDCINIQYDESMYTTLQNIKAGKDVPKIRTSKRTLMTAFGNIIRDLNNGKKVVMIGNNYGGAVINRIVDKLLLNTNKLDNIEFLSNMFCFTFGSFYIPPRDDISSKLKKYINSSNIQNFIYSTDCSANYRVGKIPNNISSTTWTLNASNLSKWSVSTKTDPLEIHYAYDTIDIVSKELESLELMIH
tara:strand:+ start:757 stop:1803 length:1047 start_codon:yes stop_codon:yes gene_type:complete